MTEAPEAGTPRVSVVLPAFNREALVGRAIDSVLAQTFADLELIVVDDASTDGTRAALERYRDVPRVRLVLSDRNLGGGGARNLGAEAARASLIAFQDSDDVWLPGKLAAQVALLDARPEAGVCYCAALYSDGPRAYGIPHAGAARLDGDMAREVLRTNPASTQVLVVRREVFWEVGGFDPAMRRFQDWDLAIRLAQATPFAFVPEPLAVVFGTPGNISSGVRNGAASRSVILQKYAALFEAVPNRAARQHWAAARAWGALGDRRAARHHLREAARLRLKGLGRPDPD